MTTCLVTVYRPTTRHTHAPRRCGEPVTRHGLCAKHAADRDRLNPATKEPA